MGFGSRMKQRAYQQRREAARNPVVRVNPNDVKHLRGEAHDQTKCSVCDRLRVHLATMEWARLAHPDMDHEGFDRSMRDTLGLPPP